ncbi:TPM domain-containing protein [Corynebacterium lizhenjunii]|uniref:TPM domain-containing protein n=1 Tax=Corynebacterium lizhenjunii TaxID=2709394 RepID=UPI0013EACCBD|nr:TPM domain-containing protein [Corynebacterium lizhenjunii]
MSFPQTSLRQTTSRLGVAAGIAGACIFGAALAGSPLGAPPAALAQPAPASITAKVTDTTGTLDESTKAAVEEQIATLQRERQLLLYIIYDGEVGTNTESYANSVVESRGGNTAAVVIDPINRQLGVWAGREWPSGATDALYEAAYGQLVGDNFPGAASAVAATALNLGAGGPAGASGSGDDAGALWLGAAGLAAVGAGGGLWAASTRRRKKDTAATLEQARGIDPKDTSSLQALPLDILEDLAQEELVSTDESIRRGKQELDLAVAEFGPERARPFTAAMNHSTRTLQHAFAQKQQIDSAGQSMAAHQRRGLLVDIVSKCGQADDALDAQAAEFAQMRDLLLNAGTKLDQLTQQLVDARARVPQARATLEALRADFAADMLSSITDNVDMAQVSLEEADKTLSRGRELAGLPAGQQGGVVAAIRDSEHALHIADRLLAAIENARTAIAAAQENLPGLITEVEGELTEAAELTARGQAQGTKANWQTLEDVCGRARQAVAAAQSGAQTDPLRHYTALTGIDGELDTILDEVRENTATHARQLQLLAQQLDVAASGIQAAEDLISARGRVIKADARTALADAKRLHAQALNTRDHDTRAALELARQAAAAADEARRRADKDINSYQRRQQSSSAGDILTGMVIGQMLGGGSSHRGGYGGGFGGGFSGGAGGSGRSGAF